MDAIGECASNRLYYCLAEVAVEPGSVRISFTGADENGRIEGCGSADPRATRAHAVACHYYREAYTFGGPREFTQPSVMEFRFEQTETALARGVPATFAELVTEGYPPVNPQAAPEDQCTSLFCRWTYPSRALRQGIEGSVIAFVGVSADGRPTSCAIFMGVDDILDRATCDRFASAYVRYEPARDKNGDPVASVTTFTMRYALN